MIPSSRHLRWLGPLAVALIGCSAGVAEAQTPNVDASFRAGANHHLGDDTFEAELGREPTAADEALRTHTHLIGVRTFLALRAATSPALEDRRAELLSDLDEYIDRGTTPVNDHLPWRSPVFIDDQGTICAIGYLIERSVGRDVAERIAKDHRYEYLEEIAAEMPEVRDWIASSGFTLEELASIQPGYMEPAVEAWKPWDISKGDVPDGAYEVTADDETTRGSIAHYQMEGDWTRTDAKGKPVGSGSFKAGSGAWKSFYPSGALMAEGHYASSRPSGVWTFYFESGKVAAKGAFTNGKRNGHWDFYYDTDAHTRIAQGIFSDARLVGTWKHYDEEGHLLAVSNDANPASWKESFGGYLLNILPGKDGVRHLVHQGCIAGDHHRLDAIVSADGSEIVYLLAHTDKIYDANGFKLEHMADGWTARDCGWGGEQKRIAHAGDVAGLHGLIYTEEFSDAMSCGDAHAVAAERGARIDRLLSSVRAVRSLSPDFVRKLALGEMSLALGETPVDEPPADATVDAPPPPIGEDGDPHDLAKVLAANMSWYVEFPHIDGRFMQVYRTLPGYSLVGYVDPARAVLP